MAPNKGIRQPRDKYKKGPKKKPDIPTNQAKIFKMSLFKNHITPIEH
jgi:hypothetical protein